MKSSIGRAWDDAAVAAAETWNRFWFEPATAGRLALVRFAAGTLGVLLVWSWAPDLQRWFGDGGIVSPDLLAAWRSPTAISLYDFVRGDGAMWGLFLVGWALMAALAVGVATPWVAPAAALTFVSLLHRGPMLAGPADDVLAAILWCLVVGRSGDTRSVDRLLSGRSAGRSWRNRTALGLLRVHGSVIAAAAVLSQLKADTWWDGTAAWWLAARGSSRLDIAGILAGSEFLTNAVTHAITLFEAGFAIGLWIQPLRPLVAGAGVVGWPLVGCLAGEPFWGAAMAILSLACLPGDDDAP